MSEPYSDVCRTLLSVAKPHSDSTPLHCRIAIIYCYRGTFESVDPVLLLSFILFFIIVLLLCC